MADTQTHPVGRVTLGLGVDNRDRDPLGLDILDGQVLWVAGVTRTSEIYGNYVFSRVVATPDSGEQPPPPLDLIVPRGVPEPGRPYYGLNPAVPYVDSLTSTRFADFISGEVLVGGKVRLASQAGWRPAVAVAGDVALATSHAYEDLRVGSGTGLTALGGRLILERSVARLDVVVENGYWRSGGEPQADRIINLGATTVDTHAEALKLPAEVHHGLGIRLRLRPPLAVVTELTLTRYVGRHTPTIDLKGPLDLLAGIQAAAGSLRITAALRYYANALEAGALRSSPLAGGVILTDVTSADRVIYLTSLGLEQAAGELRPESQKVLIAPDASIPLPANARIVPPVYPVRSEHRLGFVMAVAWTFDVPF